MDRTLPSPGAPLRPPPEGSAPLLFLARFLEEGGAIASVAPSSRWMARAAVEGIADSPSPTVVELGAGTGPVTAELVRALSGRGRALVVERDPEFCHHLRGRFPAIEVACADATDLERLLSERGIDRVDHFVSGLPMFWLPRRDRARLVGAVGRHLAPGGTFRQITTFPLLQLPFYLARFRRVGFRWVPLNLPPGGVYVCREWRGRRS